MIANGGKFLEAKFGIWHAWVFLRTKTIASYYAYDWTVFKHWGILMNNYYDLNILLWLKLTFFKSFNCVNAKCNSKISASSICVLWFVFIMFQFCALLGASLVPLSYMSVWLLTESLVASSISATLILLGKKSFVFIYINKTRNEDRAYVGIFLMFACLSVCKQMILYELFNQIFSNCHRPLHKDV